MRLSDICNLLGRDWVALAKSLGIFDSDINLIETEYPNNTTQQAMVMLRLWMTQSDNTVTGNFQYNKFEVFVDAIIMKFQFQ